MEVWNISLIELIDVWKTYDGRSDILRGVNLTVESGEVVSIAGRNGCGKTTLLNIAGCLDVPSRGTIMIKGRSISGLNEKELSEIRLRTVGFVFQDHNLIEDLTIAQNVMVPLRLAKADRREERTRLMLESFGLIDLASRRPMELSTGQRQLVAVARAFANGPPILLADEPTASLDEENRINVLQALQAANDMGAALLMTCHDRDIDSMVRRGRQYAMRDGYLLPV